MSARAAIAARIAAARPRVIAALAAHFRALDLAEDAFSEASARCLEQSEPPDNCAGWLLTVAKRVGVDVIRRREAEMRASDEATSLSDMGEILTLPDPIPDERLRLIFICCHPAIALDARVALSLKVICGLPVAEIARVFAISETAMFQRITRAKAKVREARIAFELPPRKHWGERLESVLLTLELAYTVAYQDAGGERVAIDGGDLADEVARLAKMVAELLPEEPEALGLAALIWFAWSRREARVDPDGAMVPLSRQDPAAWDIGAIQRAQRWMQSAAERGQSGPYQVMAAIQMTHARRAFGGDVDWSAILQLYDVLQAMRPNAFVALNRALAVERVHGAKEALEALNAIDADKLKNVGPFHLARAHVHSALGEHGIARECLTAALALDPPTAERLFIQSQLAAIG